jgi:hypothetical protein
MLCCWAQKSDLLKYAGEARVNLKACTRVEVQVPVHFV